MKILKGISGISREVGRAFFGGKPKAEKNSGFAKADFSGDKTNQSPFKLLFARRPKPRGPKPPKVQDDSAFSLTHGRNYATEVERKRWLKAHRNEIYKITKGRVGTSESELEDFGKQLVGGKLVKKQDYGQQGRKHLLKGLEKQYWKAKDISEKYDKEENIKVARKMFDLDKKK